MTPGTITKHTTASSLRRAEPYEIAPEEPNTAHVEFRSEPILYFTQNSASFDPNGHLQEMTVIHSFCVSLIKDEGLWVAEAPALRSCIVSGRNTDEALTKIKGLIADIIALYEEMKDPMPIDLDAEIEEGAEITYVTVTE